MFLIGLFDTPPETRMSTFPQIMYKLQVTVPLQRALISQHNLLSKKFVLMSAVTHGLDF